MGLTAVEEAREDAIIAWRQGDVALDAGLVFCHLADLSFPHSRASIVTAKEYRSAGTEIECGPTPLFDEVEGLVMLSQTCDIVRNCQERPFLEVAPLILSTPRCWKKSVASKDQALLMSPQWLTDAWS